MSITIRFKNGTELTSNVNSEGDLQSLLLDKNISSISYDDDEEY